MAIIYPVTIGLGERKLKIQKNGTDIVTFSANEQNVANDEPMIANITVPTTASDLSYSNTTSGLTADDVQEALDEIVSDIPTVNNGTLTIQKNGTNVATFSANQSSNATANIQVVEPDSTIKTNTSGQFNTITGGILDSCNVNLEPIQDLHGYSKPWVGGSGKNKYQMRTTNFSNNGVTVTANDDQTVQLSGTATNGVASITLLEDSTLIASLLNTGGTFILSIKEGVYNSNTLNVSISYKETSSGSTKWIIPDTPVTVPAGSMYISSTLYVTQGSTVQSLSNFAMQLEVGSTATTFEPYSNVCPITGHSSVEVGNVGKNRLGITFSNVKSRNTTGTWSGNVYTLSGITYKVETDDNDFIVSVTVNGANNTGSNIDFSLLSYNGSSTPENSFPSGSYIASGTPSDLSNTYIGFRTDASHSYQDRGSGTEFDIDVSQGQHLLFLTIVLTNGASLSNAVFKPMVRLATETDATFAPYQGQDITISLGQTVYGGSLDVVSGVLTITHAFGEFDGSSDETWYVTNSKFYIGALTTIKSNANAICNSYSYSGIAIDSSSVTVDKSIYLQQNNRLWVYDTSYSDVSAFKTALALQPIQVAYELATPIVIQLTPTQINTLIGENHLDIPLEGQSLDSLSYREMMAWDDVESVIDPIQNDIEWNQESNFLLKNLIIGYSASTSINSNGNPASNVSACISNRIIVNTNASYILNDDKTASGRFAHCFNDSTYLGYATVTKGTAFTPNNLQAGCNNIIFQWNQTNEGHILPTNGKVYKNVPSNSNLTSISAIGTDESGRTTASKAYAVGEHFYKDGKFGKTKVSVAQGATWTLNTNYEESTIADEFNKVSSSTATAVSGVTTVSSSLVLKFGRVVIFKCSFKLLNNVTSDNTTTILKTPFSSYSSLLPVVTFNTSSPPYKNLDTIGWIDGTDVRLRDNLNAGSYQAYCVYICQ